jgi:hypothetical protein
MSFKIIKFTLLILVISAMGFSKESREFRLGGGFEYTIFQKDLYQHWKNSPRAGVDFAFPFHPQIPVLVSLYGSYHEPIDQSQNGNEYKQLSKNLLLFSLQVVMEYNILKDKKITPVVGLGFANTSMILFEEWPPPYNSDESEIGALLLGGVSYKFHKKIQTSLIYKQDFLFSEPRFIQMGRVNLRFTYRFRGRKK